MNARNAGTRVEIKLDEERSDFRDEFGGMIRSLTYPYWNFDLEHHAEFTSEAEAAHYSERILAAIKAAGEPECEHRPPCDRGCSCAGSCECRRSCVALLEEMRAREQEIRRRQYDDLLMVLRNALVVEGPAPARQWGSRAGARAGRGHLHSGLSRAIQLLKQHAP